MVAMIRVIKKEIFWIIFSKWSVFGKKSPQYVFGWISKDVFSFFFQQYRWEVKEVQPFNRSAGPDHDYHQQSQSSFTADHQVEEDDSTQADISDIAYEASSTTYDNNSSTYERDNDLPPPAMTKTLLARFQSLEDVSKPPPTPEQSTLQQKQAVASVKINPVAGSKYQGDEVDQMEQNGYDMEHEEVAHYQQSEIVEGGEWENTPLQTDMAREADFNEILPEQGTTRNLLAKFQALQGN